VAVDIRILATSNRNLDDSVKNGDFREDLLFRLNVVNLKIPALRERPGDIIALAEHFIKKYAEANGVEERPLADDARQQLVKAQWPGNVRELENTLHRAVLLATGEKIDADAISMPDGSGLGAVPQDTTVAAQAASAAESIARAMVGRTVADVEKELILDTLDHCLGNRTHASNILGISIRTLRNKLNQYADNGEQIPAPGEYRSSGAA